MRARGLTLMLAFALQFLPAPGIELAASRRRIVRRAPPAGAFGVHLLTFAGSEPAHVGRSLELAGEAGILWLRIVIPPAPIHIAPGDFRFSAIDPLVAKAKQEGLQILGNLAYTTNWNTTAPPEITQIAQREHFPPRDFEEWGRYVFATVNRYRFEIHEWEIWNEPDLGFPSTPERPCTGGFWCGSSADFARLLAIAYREVKRADPAARVLLGGLSLAGSPGTHNENFLSEILSDPVNPAGENFDIMNYHSYGSREEAIRRMNYVRAAMAAAGIDKPVWITEAGYASDPSQQRVPPYGGGESGQAAYLRDALPFFLSLGVEKVFWFSMVDFPPGMGGPFQTYGLTDHSLEPKASYYAYRDLLKNYSAATSSALAMGTR